MAQLWLAQDGSPLGRRVAGCVCGFANATCPSQGTHTLFLRLQVTVSLETYPKSFAASGRLRVQLLEGESGQRMS